MSSQHGTNWIFMLQVHLTDRAVRWQLLWQWTKTWTMDWNKTVLLLPALYDLKVWTVKFLPAAFILKTKGRYRQDETW